MEYHEQAKSIAAALNDWASQPPKGGSAAVVPNLKMLYRQSALDTESLRILVCFGGAKPRGSFSVSSGLHREDRKWIVAITKGDAPASERGDFLTDGTANSDPFLAEVAECRDLIRGIQGISLEGPTNDYLSIEPMQLGDIVMSGYLIAFSTANDIAPLYSMPGQVPGNPQPI